MEVSNEIKEIDLVQKKTDTIEYIKGMFPDIDVDDLKSVIDAMRDDSFKFQFFRQFFPEVSDDDIPSFILILPKELVGDNSEEVSKHSWVSLSDELEEITAYDLRDFE